VNRESSAAWAPLEHSEGETPLDPRSVQGQARDSKDPRRQLGKAILGTIVGLVILGSWLYVIGFQEILDSLSTVVPAPALAAALVWMVSVGLRSWKWHILLLSTQKIPFGISGRVYWVSSFLNVLFPFRVGELARSLILKQLTALPIPASLPTVLVDRLYSIAAILLGLLFLPLTSFGRRTTATAQRLGLQSIRWGIGIVAALFLVTLLSLYLLRNQKARMLRVARRALHILPDRWTDRILSFLDTMVDSMRFVRPDRDHWIATGSAVGLLAWSISVLLVDALKDHLVLRTFGLNVPLLTCLVGVCLTNLAFILPSPPGNIGSSEWYATLVYSTGFGYDPAKVASGALFGHAMTTLVVAIGGALSLSGLGINLAESLQISQDHRAPDPDSHQGTAL
jgi:uncharacterized protein (TIRG00374 family)